MSSEEESGIVKLLKWAGIVALIAVPVYIVMKKRNEQESGEPYEDEANIFASELEE